MANTIDAMIWRLAADQHGVAGRAQLRELGIRADAIARRVAGGRLLAVSPRVVQVAGSPTTDPSRLLAAVLDAGGDAYVSHESAAATWRAPGFRIDPIFVTCRRGRVRHDTAHLATVHEPRRVSCVHVREVDGVAVSTPSLTVFDLAGTGRIGGARLGRIIDAFWARRLVSFASLERVVDEVGGRGKAGTALMRELMAQRGTEYRPPGSSLEARFEEIARGCGFTSLERQLDVSGDDGWIGRVDFIDAARQVVFEIGDALFHGSLTDRSHDELRWARLERAGYRVEPVDGFDVFHRRRELETRLRAIHQSQRPEVA